MVDHPQQGKFPLSRPRRMRKDEFSRRLMRESVLTPNDLIQPVFVMEGNEKTEPVPSMPGVSRMSIDLLVEKCKTFYELGIPAIVLFPVTPLEVKSEGAEEAWNDKGLIPRTIKAIKNAVPDLGVITDVALDPYTSHGQDGLIDQTGYVVNERTVEVLVNQALCHADAGADVVAPSDMMDGPGWRDSADVGRQRLFQYKNSFLCRKIRIKLLRSIQGCRWIIGEFSGRKQIQLSNGSGEWR